jgi:hypothetical protein
MVRNRYPSRTSGLAAAGLACFVLFLSSQPALAQTGAKAKGAYPARPVRLIVPLSPGGGVNSRASRPALPGVVGQPSSWTTARARAATSDMKPSQKRSPMATRCS